MAKSPLSVVLYFIWVFGATTSEKILFLSKYNTIQQNKVDKTFYFIVVLIVKIIFFATLSEIYFVVIVSIAF